MTADGLWDVADDLTRVFIPLRPMFFGGFSCSAPCQDQALRKVALRITTCHQWLIGSLHLLQWHGHALRMSSADIPRMLLCPLF